MSEIRDESQSFWRSRFDHARGWDKSFAVWPSPGQASFNPEKAYCSLPECCESIFESALLLKKSISVCWSSMSDHLCGEISRATVGIRLRRSYKGYITPSLPQLWRNLTESSRVLKKSVLVSNSPGNVCLSQSARVLKNSVLLSVT